VLAGGMHGRDERIHVDDLGYATAFHVDICQAIGRLEDAGYRGPAGGRRA
jgi:hypothetical protein